MNKATVKRHVRIWPATLSHLFKEGYSETAFKSDSYTGYRLTDLDRAVAAHREPEFTETPHNQKLGLPDDIFESPPSSLIGHDRVNDLLKACLLAAQQSNLLWINRAMRE